MASTKFRFAHNCVRVSCTSGDSLYQIACLSILGLLSKADKENYKSLYVTTAYSTFIVFFPVALPIILLTTCLLRSI